jgi:hypothetical protein
MTLDTAALLALPAAEKLALVELLWDNLGPILRWYSAAGMGRARSPASTRRNARQSREWTDSRSDLAKDQ